MVFLLIRQRVLYLEKQKTKPKNRNLLPFTSPFLAKDKQLVAVMHAENSKISIVLTVMKTVNW